MKAWRACPEPPWGTVALRPRQSPYAPPSAVPIGCAAFAPPLFFPCLLNAPQPRPLPSALPVYASAASLRASTPSYWLRAPSLTTRDARRAVTLPTTQEAPPIYSQLGSWGEKQFQDGGGTDNNRDSGLRAGPCLRAAAAWPRCAGEGAERAPAGPRGRWAAAAGQGWAESGGANRYRPRERRRKWGGGERGGRRAGGRRRNRAGGPR